MRRPEQDLQSRSPGPAQGQWATPQGYPGTARPADASTSQEPRGACHVISRTREQTTAAEPPPAPDTVSADPIDTGLDTLYRRHTPDLARAGDPGPVLRAAARAHRELAGHRTAGQELIRLRDGAPDGPGAVVEIVTDDMPYLVESVLAAVRRAGGEARRVIHPIVVVERAADGELRAV